MRFAHEGQQPVAAHYSDVLVPQVVDLHYEVRPDAGGDPNRPGGEAQPQPGFLAPHHAPHRSVAPHGDFAVHGVSDRHGGHADVIRDEEAQPVAIIGVAPSCITIDLGAAVDDHRGTPKLF